MFEDTDTSDALHELDISDLATSILDDLPGDEPAPGSAKTEKPPVKKATKPTVQEVETEDDDEEDLEEEDPDEEEDDADDESAEDDSEDGEDDDEEEKQPPAIAKMQKRIDTVTAKFKAEAERAEKLERELEEAEAKLQERAAERAPSTFRTPADVDQRAEKLTRLIPYLESEIAGLPSFTKDPVSGEKVENMVEIEGQEYPVAAIRQRVAELQEERRELPETKKRLESRITEDAKARSLFPAAWKRGTPAYEARRSLLREHPELANAGDRVVAQAVIGVLTLKEREARRVAPGKKASKGMKSKAAVETRAPSKTRKTPRLEGVDEEIGDLAASLDD